MDGANGVGAGKLRQFLTYCADELQVEIINDGSSGKLNYMVSWGKRWLMIEKQSKITWFVI